MNCENCEDFELYFDCDDPSYYQKIEKLKKKIIVLFGYVLEVVKSKVLTQIST